LRRTWWRATEGVDHRLYFHPHNWPVRVWALQITPAGVVWAEAEIIRVTSTHVMVRYADETARLHRMNLCLGWAPWRGVFFTSRRTGGTARAADDAWWRQYGSRTSGGVPPVMSMPLADAMALLGVPADYTRDDVIAAFKRKAKKAHPDMGGTAERFRELLEARDRLLAALGTSEPAPKAPEYAPKGVQLVYRSVRIRTTGSPRLTATRQICRRQ
jgi:hypothetical protein